MPLELLDPQSDRAKKKGYKFYYIIGMQDGTAYEQSTRTTNKTLAKQRLEKLKVDIAAAPNIRRKTFAQAADLYKAFQKLKPLEIKRLDKVVDMLGQRLVDELVHIDLVDAANRLFPGRANASLNRQVMDVVGPVLHYAATNGYCKWMRIKRFETPKLLPRPAKPEAMVKLLAKVDGRKEMLLIWLWYQGMRITQTLDVTWEESLDFDRQTVKFFDAKGPKWRELPLHEEVIALLLGVPEQDRTGRVFPWGDRHNVYRWLRPLTKALKVTFTPHMARHALGTRLNADNVGLRTIMGALGHDDPRSSIRYQDAELEVVRIAVAKSPRLRNSGRKVVKL